MESGQVSNPIHRLSLSQRAKVASALFRIQIPFNVREREGDLKVIAQRDLSIWLIYQPMASMGCPTFGQVERLTGIVRHGIFAVIKRVKVWTGEGNAERSICERLIIGNRSPLSDHEIAKLYAEIRKNPWRRGGRNENGRQVQIDQ